MLILPLLAVWLEPVAPSAEIIQRAGPRKSLRNVLNVKR